MRQAVSKCRSCQAEIVWLETARGKRMPVDVETVQPGDTEFEYGRHISHFVSCPNADEHRKSRG